MKVKEEVNGLSLYRFCLFFRCPCSRYTRSRPKMLTKENTPFVDNITGFRLFYKAGTDNPNGLFVFQNNLNSYTLRGHASEGNPTKGLVFGRELFDYSFLLPDVITEGEPHTECTYKRRNAFKEVIHKTILG